MMVRKLGSCLFNAYGLSGGLLGFMNVKTRKASFILQEKREYIHLFRINLLAHYVASLLLLFQYRNALVRKLSSWQPFFMYPFPLCALLKQR